MCVVHLEIKLPFHSEASSPACQLKFEGSNPLRLL